MLHVEDLFDLIVRQMGDSSSWDGRVYNVGGGHEVCASLRELTAICQEVTGHRITITGQATTSPLDVRMYLTDNGRVGRDFNWRPVKSVHALVEDIYAWLREHEKQVPPIFTYEGMAR